MCSLRILHIALKPITTWLLAQLDVPFKISSSNRNQKHLLDMKTEINRMNYFGLLCFALVKSNQSLQGRMPPTFSNAQSQLTWHSP